MVRLRSISDLPDLDLSSTLFLDSKAEIKWDYRGDIREYFNESKIV